MARYRASIETDWTPDEAFTYLSDFSTSAEWDPGVVEARRVGAAAGYLDALVDDQLYEAVAWTYPRPVPRYAQLKEHVAFYPGRVDGAWLDDERVLTQDGDFYGGWISADLVGPFKGAPGTFRW